MISVTCPGKFEHSLRSVYFYGYSEERQNLMEAIALMCFVLDPICYPGQEPKM